MTPASPDAALAALYRSERQRVFATLVRLLGGFDVAEEALHDAFVAAAEQWPAQGLPANPVAWLVSTGRFRAIDRMRRDRRFVAWDDAAERIEATADEAPGWEEAVDARDAIEDDRLRLVFTCCHPSLAEEARIALTLREVCGLTTEAIASAFLIGTPALAQRIVRAKSKIAAAKIPYEVPPAAERPARLASVLRVVYLVFNEAQDARAGPPDAPRRASWCRSRSRTGGCGTATRSRRAPRWPCRPRSPLFMPRPPAPRPPTGRRSSASTTRSCVSSRVP